MHTETGGMNALAFEEYAGVIWPSLYRSAYLLTGNHADAEDIAQQTLLNAYRSWSRVIRSDSLDAYLRRVLTNAFLSARRPKKRRLELLTATPPEPDVAQPPHAPEDRLMLWPHVTSLPPRQRAVIVLRYYEGLSEQEIADALGCSRGNVKSTAHHALKTLRAALCSERTDGREN
ncbi:SigE family RNA polymerase sigma factor [Streptomyces litchfieldiae]|uniref:RNA polymerase sigma factor n=1 Tax=Streptomyces litchfieldiae TaxID=3075543 RepID=A0ABU2MTJ8_9ACTN|nr:SigE family RNA polymerase sigma factor [Streptomyces sp. DSM 44938]MDT0344960.1 SigE family RNA polymerase sigma factor [Streptomyces sp. DSM 44938]